MKRLWLLGLLGLLLGCTDATDDVAPPPDGGGDAGALDAGMPDTGVAQLMSELRPTVPICTAPRPYMYFVEYVCPTSLTCVTCDLRTYGTDSFTPVVGCLHPQSLFYCAPTCVPGCIGH